jgi:RNA polymerase sigma-70 factor (ECF subfamily)
VLFGRKSKVEDFEAVALPHLKDLYRTASRVVGDASEAEDLVQEAYFQAWKSFDRFEAGTNCRAWLFKILFNVISHYRRKRFGLKLASTAEDDLEDTLRYEPPVRQDISDEDVLSALQKLPEKYRQVVLLADVQEFSYKEVADTLRIPVGTVMSRLSRARTQLRVELSEFASGYGIATTGERGKTA